MRRDQFIAGWFFAFGFIVLALVDCSPVFGDPAADRAKALADLEGRHKTELQPLKKELDKVIKTFDQYAAREEKLEDLMEDARTAPQKQILSRDLEKVKQLRQAAFDRGEELKGKIADLATRYEQNRRRVILKQPLPNDPEYVEENGFIFTRDELDELAKLKVDHGSPEVAADNYIQDLLKKGTLEAATRTRVRPFQLVNGPPSNDSMMVFYRCRYVSQGGFVNEREGYVIVGRDQRGFWFITGLTKMSGIIF